MIIKMLERKLFLQSIASYSSTKKAKLSCLKLGRYFQACTHLQDIGKLTAIRMLLFVINLLFPHYGCSSKCSQIGAKFGMITSKITHNGLDGIFFRLAQPKNTPVPFANAQSEIGSESSTLHIYFSKRL